MVRIIGCLLLVLLPLTGCNKAISKSDLGLLEGYWEIEEVAGADGSSRKYGLNATIDYIHLDDGMLGYRKKVQPQLDGSFITSDDAAGFEIFEKDGAFIMVYKSAGQEWSEQLIKLDTLAFSVVSAENITYHYKRFQPLVATP